jgi:hypothetical protein
MQTIARASIAARMFSRTVNRAWVLTTDAFGRRM